MSSHEVSPPAPSIELYASGKYLTIDGVDGAGASSLGQAVAQSLTHSGKKVLLVEIAHAYKYRTGEPRAKKYPHPDHPRITLAFLNQVKRVYQGLIIPELDSHDLVIGVTSEVRSIMYGFLKNPGLDTFDYIQRGIATLGLLPLHRVIVTASPTTISSVMAQRESEGTLSEYDPKPGDLEAIAARLKAMEEARTKMLTLPHSINHYITNNRAQTLSEIAQSLVTRITPLSTQ